MSDEKRIIYYIDNYKYLLIGSPISCSMSMISFLTCDSTSSDSSSLNSARKGINSGINGK